MIYSHFETASSFNIAFIATAEINQLILSIAKLEKYLCLIVQFVYE